MKSNSLESIEPISVVLCCDIFSVTILVRITVRMGGFLSVKFALIKSPRSGVTLCFQFVSAASASAAAKTFASHVKTVSAKP